MSKNVDKYRGLLSRFLSLPKGNTNPTFMDICRMGGDRFEERCSQILRFYFSLNEPHNLRDLFFSSLMSLLPQEDGFDYRCPNEVTVVTEDHTEDRNRIDLVVIADDVVFAIENKINARLQNDLADYRSHIEKKYSQKDKRFVVLSVKNITDNRELSKIKRNRYVYINYRDFFSEIKNRLGLYAMNGDSAYITFLFDFIRTIENNYYYANMELKEFFANNQADIDSLIKEYNKYKADVWRQQGDRIRELKNLISKETGRDWDVWGRSGWDLGVIFNKDGDKEIGIESSFKPQGANPLAEYHIYITVWKRKCFEPYRQELEKEYKGCWIDENGVPNRVYLHLPVVNGDDTDKIIEALTECFDYMDTLTQKIR